MKSVQYKILASFAAAAAVALTLAPIVRGHASASHPQVDELSLPAPIMYADFGRVGPRDLYRNVVLTGKIVYKDGKPAVGIAVVAQCQDAAFNALLQSYFKARDSAPGKVIPATKEQQEESGNNAVSNSKGVYTFAVGADMPYNIMVYDFSGKWVAAAIEGVRGKTGRTVNVPVLVLTKGAIIRGTVRDHLGLPASRVYVSGYDSDRPDSSAAVDVVLTDSSGHYRLRVAPGICRVYTADGKSMSDSKTVTMVSGEIKVINLRTP